MFNKAKIPRPFGDNITEEAVFLGYTEIKKELNVMAAMNINQKQFEAMMQEGEILLVDYWAPWCGYCRRIGPAYEKIAEQYEGKIVVAKVNIDEEPRLAMEERIEVIPTLVLYRDGKAIGSIVAPESKAMIEGFIEQSLAK